MSYLKFKANNIFSGTEMFSDEYVLIAKQDGTIEAIVKQSEAGDDLQYFNGILSPGFINTHCHLELSHLKGIIREKTGLVNFILDIVANRNSKEDIILQAIKDAEDTMLKNGIVAVGDICNTTYTLYQKKQNNLAYYNFIETSGWIPNIAEKKYNEAVNLYNQFSPITKTCSIVPHAPYSVSNELWCLIEKHFQNKIISIHNQEANAENELFLNGTGAFMYLYQQMNITNNSFQPTKKSSLQSYFHWLENTQNILLVHNTCTSEKDIHFLHQQPEFIKHKLFFCLCPNANLYIEDTLPNINLLRESNIQLTLGTDSLASNNNLNIVNEIKTLQTHYPKITLAEILQWATINGAKALDMEDTLGSFEKGKKPGIILLENTNDIKRLV
ncbi:MAG TPA: amidohydrolase family protein [Chitinophagaceae bacterium]|nr:amidohydrolase family protein [Chitinophagaceae bacterium]HNM33820.1 amidohydrolase family protein [Chitinophagaceae bacterium]